MTVENEVAFGPSLIGINENEEVFVPWVPFCLTRLTLITLCLSVVLRHLALSCVIARLIEDDKRESIARELT